MTKKKENYEKKTMTKYQDYNRGNKKLNFKMYLSVTKVRHEKIGLDLGIHENSQVIKSSKEKVVTKEISW